MPPPLRITIPELRRDFERLLDELRAPGLDTDELRARYRDVLRAVTELENTRGAAILDGKMRTAFRERVRYQAKRLVETEIRREYNEARAKQMKRSPAVYWLRWTLSPDHPAPDICDYLAGVDQYGLGPGVYPKLKAPVPPAHPHCRCSLFPVTLPTGTRSRFDPNAAQEWFEDQFATDAKDAARIAGSRDKLARVISGDDPVAILNDGRPEEYQLQTVTQRARG